MLVHLSHWGRCALANIGPLVTIAVPDIDAALEDYTSIQLERASTFGGSYSLIQTISLSADDTEYNFRDSTGTATSWYRWRLYNSTGPVASTYSEPFPASTTPTTTRQELRQRAAHRLGLYLVPPTEWTFPGPSGTTTGAGSTSTIVCSSYADASFSDRGDVNNANVFAGMMLYISSGDQSGKERRVVLNGLDTTTGTFEVSPAWAGAPGSGVTFEGYGGGLSASEWNGFLEDARLDLWYPAEVAITGVASQTHYGLPYWVERDDQIIGFTRRSGDAATQHQLYRGQDFTVLPQEGGGAVLHLPSGIAANSVYLLNVYRHPAPFTSDTAAVPLAEQYQRIWWMTAAMRAAQHKAQAPWETTEHLKMWRDRFEELVKELRGLNTEVAWRNQRSPRRAPMVWVGGGRW